MFDNSPPDGSPGILLAFVEGDEARLLGRASARVRRRAVLDSLARYFGPRAASPADYLELDWQQERWTGGCYGTLFGPNVWTRYGYALSKPVGLIHWAGTETATRWCGYLDGAVRSGERAAAEVRGTDLSLRSGYARNQFGRRSDCPVSPSGRQRVRPFACRHG